ncbi:MMPL family transporter [Dactylosporangium siamense]|uniref:Membrane protein n=1 Tax=Dactylosporangium siamense TaxID=685454 RepID=A0A919UC61_9ACTN|nr:MMPL family transporter [Dactylosporangium siamense]GIG45343.1 putative membrane protein [Dactylosporangium siamense]
MFRILTALALRRPVMVIVFWVAVVAVGFGVGGGVFMKLTAQVATVPGSETERALQVRDDAAGPRPAQLTVVATGGVALADVRGVPGVVDVGEPLPSDDGQAVLLQVTVSDDASAEAVATKLRAVDPARVTVTGGPLTDSEFAVQAQSDVQRAELFTLPAVLILLVIVFGGLLAGAMPLLVAVAGIGGTFGLLYALSFGTDISVYAIQVATMLSVGLAVDYGLLLISRFRTSLAENAGDVPAALATAVDKAGRTIAVTGLTVAASLLGLAVFPDAFLRSMGLAGTGVVLVNMFAVLTLLPAVLKLTGRRIRPAPVRTGDGVFGRLAVAVQRRPVLTTVLTAAGLLALAVPALHLRLGNSDARALPSSTQTRQQHDQLAAHYPAFVGPDDILAVVRSPADAAATQQFADRVRGVPGVTAVRVEPVSAAVSVVRATPAHRPETAQGRATVIAVRDVAAPFEVLVTGDAARLVDYRSMLARYGPIAALIVVAATIVLLAAFTRSLLLPLKAVLTSVLSIGAALGVVTLVFQDRGDLGMIDLTVPVLVAAIAFGLSVDYEVFLLARIREHRLTGADSRRSVAVGLQQTGRIVTSAALLLVVVFAGFLLGGFAPIREIGLGLVVAIVLDATVVRMLLVPATMTLLGRAAWWPGRVPPAPAPAAPPLVSVTR